MDDEEKKSYLEAILAVARRTSASSIQSHPMSEASLFDASSADAIKQRFTLVMNGTSNLSKGRVEISSLLILLFLISYLFILQPVSYPDVSEVEGSFVISPGNSYILVSENGTADLYVDNEYKGEIIISDLDDETYRALPIYER